LLARAVIMVAGGAPRRMKRLTALLLYLELVADAIGFAAGLWAWVWSPPRSRTLAATTGNSRSWPIGASWPERVAVAAAVPIYLPRPTLLAICVSPGQGRRDDATARDRPSDHESSPAREIAAGVYWLPVRGANVYFVRSGSGWVLIDTAWANCAGPIQR